MPKNNIHEMMRNNTKKKIKDAYVALLDQKDPQKITVSEICRMVKINRGTFYLHFQDTIAVREELEDDIITNALKQTQDIMDSCENDSADVLSPKERYEQMANNPLWQKLFFGKHPSDKLLKIISSESRKGAYSYFIKNGLIPRQAEILSVFMEGGAMAIEKYRHENPWVNFDIDDKYYADFLCYINKYTNE